MLPLWIKLKNEDRLHLSGNFESAQYESRACLKTDMSDFRNCLNNADLSVESVSEYIKTETSSGTPLPKGRLDVGVWYDDVSVVIAAYGVNAETAYEVLSSMK